MLWVLFNFLLRSMFVLIFTGVSSLISYFTMNLKKYFFKSFFHSSFYFQSLLSRKNFLVNELVVRVPWYFHISTQSVVLKKQPEQQ